MEAQPGTEQIETTRAPLLRRFIDAADGLRWEDVPLKEYKADGGTHFKDITRQVLFGGGEDQPCEIRYFEVGPGGHSTFEKHVHTHAIMVLHGKGRAVVGDRMVDLAPFDLVYVPPLTWHQLQAEVDRPLGFICLVNCERDRPVRPENSDLAELRKNSNVGSFIRV